MRPNHRDKLFKRARKLLQKELDLVGIIQKLRFYDAVIAAMIPSEKIKVLKDKTRKLNVSDAKAIEKAINYSLNLPTTPKKR